MPPLPPRVADRQAVAVVGSGPAGLAAAQQLTRAGHTVTVYERADRIGGLLRYGIPEFKMEKRHLDRRLDQMEAEGTKFSPCGDVGGRPRRRSCATGTTPSCSPAARTVARDLPVPGRELDGIHQAMEYLPLANQAARATSSSPISAAGKHVVIIGGGDTGADCLGTAHGRARCRSPARDHAQAAETRAGAQPWPTCPLIYRVASRPRGGRRAGLRRLHRGVRGDADGAGPGAAC